MILKFKRVTSFWFDEEIDNLKKLISQEEIDKIFKECQDELLVPINSIENVQTIHKMFFKKVEDMLNKKLEEDNSFNEVLFEKYKDVRSGVNHEIDDLPF